MMATIENWNNLNFSEVFEIYPLLGTELIWLIFVVVYWIYWHIASCVKSPKTRID